ncbi:MAG: hypothetical protein KA144_06930 [Xanthomonadaceae bacterium]|nr:hypothetical protein [Xanthomonadaceae bacterium]
MISTRLVSIPSLTYAPPAVQRFDADLGDWRLIAFNIGPDRALFGLWVPRVDETGDGLPSRAPQARRRYRVVSHHDSVRTLDLAIDDAPLDLHDAQPLGDDVLLIGGRSRRHANGDAEANGRLYGADGAFRRAIVLGDGIGTVQTARDGTIWTGYFDEGVFGNLGWTEPLGASGLVAWGDDGAIRYRYSPPASTDAIVDCYAINVADDATWCYYYTDFPLVRIEHGRETGVWRPEVRGAHGFAVGAGYALFGGGYGDYDRIRLIALKDDGRCETLADFALEDERGRRLPGHHCVGRGQSLYFRNDEAIHRFDIGTALRLVRERRGH